MSINFTHEKRCGVTSEINQIFSLNQMAATHRQSIQFEQSSSDYLNSLSNESILSKRSIHDRSITKFPMFASTSCYNVNQSEDLIDNANTKKNQSEDSIDIANTMISLKHSNQPFHLSDSDDSDKLVYSDHSIVPLNNNDKFNLSMYLNQSTSITKSHHKSNKSGISTFFYPLLILLDKSGNFDDERKQSRLSRNRVAAKECRIKKKACI